MKLSEIAASIEREALRAGHRDIDGKRISSFSQELLSVGEGSLSEHLDIQASAGLFYYVLLRKAERREELFKTRFKEWFESKYAIVNDHLISQRGKRVNIRDVEQATRNRFEKKYGIMKRRADRATKNRQTIEDWILQWKQKAFSMDAMARVLGPTESGVRADIDKHLKKHSR